MHDNKEQLEAYALGALDADEVARVEEYLRHSPEQRQELADLQDIVALLPYAALDADPPDRVKQRLMNRIAADAPTPAAHPEPSSPSPRLKRSSGRAWAPFAAIAAVLLLALSLGLAGMVFSLQNTVSQLQQANTTLQNDLAAVQTDVQSLANAQLAAEDQLAASQEQVARLNTELAASQRAIDMLNAQFMTDQRLATFITAPGVATRRLVAVNDGSQASGEMYMYPGNREAVVLFRELPALEPGQVYQFWLANESGQIAAGTLQAGKDGLARLHVTAPREVNAFNQVMLTVEPEGGSQEPSDEVVLEGVL